MVDAKTNDGIVQQVQDLLGAIDKSKFADKEKAHVRLWFRGQPNATWQLTPGVYRPTFPAANESVRLNLERHLAQDFRVQSAGMFENRRRDTELYFLQQHYRLPTRLLDWTLSPLAALHFAVTCEQEKDSDAALFMMDAYRLAHCQGATTSFEGVATSRSEIFHNALHVIFDWQGDATDFPKFLLPIRPEYFDLRLALQKGCFTFHVPGRESLTRKENDSLHCFFIPKAAKPSIGKELFLLGIDTFSIYGDLESLSTRLKFAYKIP